MVPAERQVAASGRRVFRHEADTPARRLGWLNGGMREGRSRTSVPVRDQPTVKQVYALAAALCEQAGESFPETKTDASELIERIRAENGRPDAPPHEEVVVTDRGG